VIATIHQVAPPGEIGFGRFLMQVLQDQLVHSLLSKIQWHLVNVGHGFRADHGLLFHVAEGGNFLLDVTV